MTRKSKGGLSMYLVVELMSGRKVLFESQQELEEYLNLNKLQEQVELIRQIDRTEYNQIMRGIAGGFR
jgi:hypothetical protein